MKSLNWYMPGWIEKKFLPKPKSMTNILIRLIFEQVNRISSLIRDICLYDFRYQISNNSTLSFRTEKSTKACNKAMGGRQSQEKSSHFKKELTKDSRQIWNTVRRKRMQ